MTTTATRTLSSTVEIPLLGFGTYLIPQAEAAAAVGEALKAGYRHIDTAEFYANEDGVGAGLRAANLERKEVFITTKLWPGNAAWGQTPKTTETTLAALDQSLAKLKLDYVDLYLIHAPFEKEQRLAQWRGLVELKKQGKTRSIGVSNFNINHLEELKAAGLPQPEANQIELHPWSQKPELVGYLEKHGIVPIAYSSLVPLSTWRTAPGHASGKTAQMKQDSEASPFKALAKKYGKTESQILLRWAVQKNWPVLPKSTRPERIRENADLFSFSLDAGDMAAIAKMDRGDGIAWGSQDPVKAK